MNWLTRHTAIIVLLLITSVFIQLGIFGVYLLGFRFAVVILFALCLPVAGILTTLFIRPACEHYFLAGDSVPVWVDVMLERQAQKLAINKPVIKLSNAAGMNAFAVGDLSGSGVVVLQQEIFRQLTQDEVEAVLAHESSHIAMRHSMVLTLLQGTCALPALPLVLLASLLFSLIYDIGKFRQLLVLFQGFSMTIMFPLTSLLIASFTRFWEYHADSQAAQLVGREKYIAALRCLHGSFFQHPNLLSTASVIHDQTRKEGWALSHPSLMQRINALRSHDMDDG